MDYSGGHKNRPQLADKKCKLSTKLFIMHNRWKLFMDNFVYKIYYFVGRSLSHVSVSFCFGKLVSGRQTNRRSPLTLRYGALNLSQLPRDAPLRIVWAPRCKMTQFWVTGCRCNWRVFILGTTLGGISGG